MRRTIICLTCLATLPGCVLWRRPPPPPASPAGGPAAPSRAPAPAPPAPVSSAEECARIAELAGGGEHKPAVEAMWPLIETGHRCPAEIESAARDSFRRLAEADAFLHQGETRRGAGDLAGAEESMRAALAVYPSYPRAARLLDEVARQRAEQRRSAAESAHPAAIADAGAEPVEPVVTADDEQRRHRRRLVEQSLGEARDAQARDELEGAARLTLQALDAEPHEPGLKLQLIEFAERLGLALFSDGSLQRAKEIWQRALALDDANVKLRSYLEQVQRRLDSLERIKQPGSG